ncbi:zwei Ig domain protein zig-8 isoform X2 [Lepeophtheirus salmonis]|uniref:zwei Ig domain protein zig-8 isoform X2 n=1 Tax=Lepeophtheirus salmonis TaxID=72036 RepID=UPI003AF3A5AC
MNWLRDGSLGMRDHLRHNHHAHHRYNYHRSPSAMRHRREESSGSIFGSHNGTVVRAHIGSTATLSCIVKEKSQYGMITWARLEDEYRPYSVLTVGDSTYVDDKRILVAKPLQQNKRKDWALQIKKVTTEDAGRYECQATTHPPQSIVIQLKVVEAFAMILGSKEKILKSGSNLKIHCILKRATEKPLYIFWFHDDKMIAFNADHGVEVINENDSSTLYLRRPAVKADSGNYTCHPYNIRPASVLVHIIDEPQPSGRDSAPLKPSKGKPEKGSMRPPPSAAVLSSGIVHRPLYEFIFWMLLLYFL